MYPILTEKQYSTLQSLGDDTAITQFLDKFWEAMDSTSGVESGESKSVYGQRLEYANTHFPDRRGWGRSDRKRIYLRYGPPTFVDHYDYTDNPLGELSTIKAYEIWLYMTPGRDDALPSYGDDVYPGEKKFIFVDLTGFGFYTIFYSSEDAGDIDVRALKGPS